MGQSIHKLMGINTRIIHIHKHVHLHWTLLKRQGNFPVCYWNISTNTSFTIEDLDTSIIPVQYPILPCTLILNDFIFRNVYIHNPKKEFLSENYTPINDGTNLCANWLGVYVFLSHVFILPIATAYQHITAIILDVLVSEWLNVSIMVAEQLCHLSAYESNTRNLFHRKSETI